jgi:hypothetical protein
MKKKMQPTAGQKGGYTLFLECSMHGHFIDAEKNVRCRMHFADEPLEYFGVPFVASCIDFNLASDIVQFDRKAAL